jgi:hypothetical protein
MSEQDLTPEQLEQLREQLASVPAGAVVAETAVSLVTMAQLRLGLPPEQYARFRDLDAARLLIDALGGCSRPPRAAWAPPSPAPPGPGRPAPGLRRAGRQPAEAGAGPRAPPPRPSRSPEDPGILRPPSGLWVPGRTEPGDTANRPRPAGRGPANLA